MKENRWKNIWDSRVVDIEHNRTDEKALLLELKRGNGFDVAGEGLAYEELIGQYQHIKAMLFPDAAINGVDGKGSVYEVGCGSGANLYLFEKDGMRCGGLDFSQNLLRGGAEVLRSKDLTCAEANQTPEEPIYDAVLSNSVFSYFVDEGYALSVLEKMYRKARRSIGIIDIHDKEKEKGFVEYRKKMMDDYEGRYKGLPKLFYRKGFFEEFAKAHGMDILFTDSCLKGYWNNGFVFSCFMYK